MCRRLALALLFSAALAPRGYAADSAAAFASSADDELTRARIRDMRMGMRDVPLPLIIEALANHHVVPWNGEQAEALEAVAEAVRTSINQNGVDAARVNEAGNAVEDFVLDALRRAGFRAGRPVALSGRARVVGYPDLEATREGAPFYVEVKTYGPATIDSTQRTFYLSPSGDFKVTHDAHHLLIAVELEPSSPGHYRALAVRWLDLSRLRCDLKYEFNANNRDLYRAEAGLTIIERAAEAKPAVMETEPPPTSASVLELESGPASAASESPAEAKP